MQPKAERKKCSGRNSSANYFCSRRCKSTAAEWFISTVHNREPKTTPLLGCKHYRHRDEKGNNNLGLSYSRMCALTSTLSPPIACLPIQQLLELYSLMKEVALVIESCQSTKVPSAPSALQRIVALLDLLDPSKPLLLHDPEHYFVLPKNRGQAQPANNKTRVSKHPEELTGVAKTARAKLHASIFKRFAAKRYGKKYKEESHLFDMAVAFNPAMREHGYIDRLAESASLARQVKDKVWLQIARVAEKVIISKRAEEQRVSGAKGGGERYQTAEKAGGDIYDGSSSKRVKIDVELSEAVMSTYKSSGLFDKPADKSVRASERAQKSPLEEAKGLVKEWRKAQAC